MSVWWMALAGWIVVCWAVAWGITRLFTAGFTRVARRAELARLREQIAPGSDVRPRRRDLLVVSAAALLMLGAPLVHVSRGVAGLALVVGILGNVAVWIVHAVPGHDRKLKYIALAASAAAIAVGSSSVLGENAARGSLPQIWAIWMAGVVLATLAYAVLVVRAFEPLDAGARATAAATRWHRRLTWLQGPDALSLLAWTAMSFTGLASAYLILRFCTGEKLRTRPFVYLRSFSLDDAQKTFGTIIMPALYRQGIVSGLVHVKQTSLELHTSLPPLWRASFQAVGDDRWKLWIEAALAHSTAAIIDLSTESESLRWELETASRVLGPERLLILHHGEVNVSAVPAGARLVDIRPQPFYSPAVPVAQWAASMMEAMSGIKEVAPKTRARRQLPMGVIAIPAGLTIAALALSEIVLPALKFTKQARTSEAHWALERLGESVKRYWAGNHSLPPSVGMTPPEGTCCMDASHRCWPTLDWWNQPTWQSLYFALDDPHRFTYSFQNDGASFTARAVADLDCDGHVTTFVLAGHVIGDSTLRLEPITSE